jgi:dTDP-4-dehydrorhamnose 3,5-epimerase
MKASPTEMPGVVLLEPEVHADGRGFLFESWNQQRFNELVGEEVTFVQENHSRSARGVLRGIHYQLDPHPQGKLVRVAAGAVFDVVVDLRRSHRGFGTWTGVELSANNRRQLWVPPGFGHAFLALEEGTEVLYRITDYRQPDCERAIRWNDPDLAIEWAVEADPILSARDAQAPHLREAEVFV